jgi:S1-C subfamily serine protease
VPLLIFVLVLLVVVVGISLRRAGNPEQNSSNIAKPPLDQSPKATQFDEAVLMIVGMNAKGSPVSQGSGFLLSSDGLAGSNYHVVRGATKAYAECCNGRKFEVLSIEGADLEKDLVVFQLYEIGKIEKPQNLPHVVFAPSKDLKVGQRVIAVGSPQGLENTVSDGILSAIRESDSVRYLQITAPISPGSSGGPVLDSDGHMIGVATFQFEKGQNLNFAVAADYIQPLLKQHFQVPMKQFQNLVRRGQRREQGVAITPSAGDAADHSWFAQQLPEEYLFACSQTDPNRCSKTATHLNYSPEQNILMETEDFQDYYLDTDKKARPSYGHWYVTCPLHPNENGHWIGECTYSLLWTEPGKTAETACTVTTSEEITEITRKGHVSGISGKIDWKPRNDPINPQCPTASGTKAEFHLVPKQ